MAEFKAITTQEELDLIIENRLKREREKVSGQTDKYENELKTLREDLEVAKNKAKEHDDIVSKLKTQVATAEKSLLKVRVARDCGIPLELSEKLSGDTEEDLRKDAESIAPFLAKKGADPSVSTEPATVDSEKTAYKQLLSNLKGV